MIKIKLDDGAYMPKRAHELDAGYDIQTPKRYLLRAHDSIVIDTGVHIQIPEGHAGFLKSKSGLNCRYGIIGEGVIDSGYTGSIKARLYNSGEVFHIFEKGDKIIQLVIAPVLTEELVQVDELDESERGDSGFGSTGR